MANPYGDVELDARGMRALAHPVRVAVLSELQRHGPSTATLLSPIVGASPSVTSWHLRHLAEHGLVRDAAGRGSGRERWWEATSRGFRSARRRPRVARGGPAPRAGHRGGRGRRRRARGTARSSRGSRRSGSTSRVGPAPGCS